MTRRSVTAALIMSGASVAATMAHGESMDTKAGRLRPDRLHDALMAQSDVQFDFIVAMDEAGSQSMPSVAGDQKLQLVNGVSRRMTVRDATELAAKPGVKWVWYLHPDEAQITVNTLKALDYAAATMAPPRLVNLSLGPPTAFYRERPDPGHPIAEAIKSAAGYGMVTVMAIGNMGTDAPGYVNPWTAPDEVISVGAWDHTTGGVWAHSSRPVEQAVDLWPDVVAPGIDVIGPMTTARPKTAAERHRDETNMRFRAEVPQSDWDKYTLKSGTSQAAAVVSGSAAQIVRFLQGVMQENGARAGRDLFAITVEADRITDHDRAVQRLTGRATPHDDGTVTYTYQVDVPWKMVKQILMDTALPIANAQPWDAGAGLVDPAYIRAQFGAYGIEPPQYLPIKVK